MLIQPKRNHYFSSIPCKDLMKGNEENNALNTELLSTSMVGVKSVLTTTMKIKSKVYFLYHLTLCII